MRTTISFDDQVLRATKRLAAERGVTVSRVVEDALRAVLAAKPARPARPFKLITFRGNGPRPGIDLDRTSALLEQDDVERHARRP